MYYLIKCGLKFQYVLADSIKEAISKTTLELNGYTTVRDCIPLPLGEVYKKMKHAEQDCDDSVSVLHSKERNDLERAYFDSFKWYYNEGKGRTLKECFNEMNANKKCFYPHFNHTLCLPQITGMTDYDKELGDILE